MHVGLSYYVTALCSVVFDSKFQGVLYWEKRKPVLIVIQMTIMAMMNTRHYSEIVFR